MRNHPTRSDDVTGEHNRSRSVASRFAQRLLAATGSPPVQLRLWNGDLVASGEGPPRSTLDLRDARTLWRLLSDPERGFAEGYADGSVGFSGDLTEFLVDIYQRAAAHRAAGKGRVFRGSLTRARPSSLQRARSNIHSHYDLGNRFYQLWLDPQLLYTCAYYPTETTSLADAQQAKIDHIARKLRLRPGQTVIDAGCGWGGFALAVAQRYGVKVRAFNVSSEQIAHARSAAAAAGLSDRVTFIEDDYRNITGSCDAFVSIGMLEHVGIAGYGELGNLISRVLAPDGCGLIHSIGRSAYWPMSSWIQERIFPGAEVPSIAEMMEIFAPNEFAIIDVENLRHHYALTLRDWLTGFERESDVVRRMFDEEFVRAWRLYLTGSLAAFLTGELQLFQMTFAPRSNIDWPLTRSHLYS